MKRPIKPKAPIKPKRPSKFNQQTVKVGNGRSATIAAIRKCYEENLKALREEGVLECDLPLFEEVELTWANYNYNHVIGYKMLRPKKLSAYESQLKTYNAKMLEYNKRLKEYKIRLKIYNERILAWAKEQADLAKEELIKLEGSTFTNREREPLPR